MVSNVRVFTADAHNVYAFRNNHKKNTIVICAHHDHIGINEYENSRHTGPAEIHNGADDNASGVAAMLEMARTLKGKNTKRTTTYLSLLAARNSVFGLQAFRVKSAHIRGSIQPKTG